MNRLRKFTVRGVLLLFCLLVFLGISTAQENSPVSTLTLSEDLINTMLRSGIQNEGNDFFVDLQPGQIMLNLVITGQRGNTNEATLTLVPAVSGGELNFDATEFTLNGTAFPINNDNNAVNAASDNIGSFLDQQTRGGQVQSILVAEDRISLEWRSNNPSDPAITIRDELVSLTFTESSINGMPWVTNPEGDYVTAIGVDLQDGQAVINVSRSIEPMAVSYIIKPTVINGYVAWQVKVDVGTQAALANSLLTLWRAYFGRVYGDASLTNAVVANDTVTFTWDLSRFDGEPQAEPIVTYTIDESEVNTAFAEFLPDGVTALSVDMQPTGLVINATGVGVSGNPYSASLRLIPQLSSGRITWQAESLTTNDATLDAAALRAESGVTRPLTQGLNPQQNNAFITDFQMTDTQISVTVEYR